MQSLPLDLLENVSQSVEPQDKPTLHAVTLVCRAGRSAGQRQLFHLWKIRDSHHADDRIRDATKLIQAPGCKISLYVRQLELFGLKHLILATLLTLVKELLQLTSLTIQDSTLIEDDSHCEHEHPSLKELTAKNLRVLQERDTPPMREILKLCHRWAKVSILQLNVSEDMALGVSTFAADTFGVHYLAGSNVRPITSGAIGLRTLAACSLQDGNIEPFSNVLRQNSSTVEMLELGCTVNYNQQHAALGQCDITISFPS